MRLAGGENEYALKRHFLDIRGSPRGVWVPVRTFHSRKRKRGKTRTVNSEAHPAFISLERLRCRLGDSSMWVDNGLRYCGRDWSFVCTYVGR